DGPDTVQVIEAITLHDGKRDKDVLLKIYAPASGGPFPVIIFSHGAGASKDAYGALGRFWASYGYVCIHPTHADSLALRGAAGLRGLVGRTISDPEGWRNRVRDITFVLDSLGEIERKEPALKGK